MVEVLGETPVCKQLNYTARFDWGYEGVEQVGATSDMIVIIDVLSFSTCVDIVTGRGGIVYPYQVKDESAVAFATQKAALLAGKRGEPISLSPACLKTVPMGSRMVLPSPNGSTCTLLAKKTGAKVIAACLRNASSVARYIQQQKGTVTVIACGERWGNGALRPAIEDMIAAGALLHELEEYRLSPEAKMAVAAFRSAQDHLLAYLQKCASGQELISKGYPEDVALAAEWNQSCTVPVLNADFAYEAN
ncbi:2-phosphosulfolactate phosphatase [Brevibacillus porteri]|uniref:Probable 2-phosphosulfolactate phosphatase n=1 Tax=Brevibacillus porteri TaxID=2126350 RepID=A0ABX5FVF3_9BACL|nr:2-phosphosulfolactate phosphatase [Brevibacillus porteri]MED1798782.1 2-phosphosulfolactate phosphatase [Brevibacillus porteri]MED2131465.1 2-phosphosulfolactate phosphatase [Brevibacillus porteri]MED2896550.1 2-phosphosulfolactate phosphatase [Brevibacillus porteri]PSK14530.1 phosphosulfolactate phosphohydrolase [Brevibacillus porteri]